MCGTRQRQFSTVIFFSVLALVVNHLDAQNSVHFYSSSPSNAFVSTTEQASVVVEQSEVASGRSIRGGSFRQANDNNNNNNNPNERPLRTTGFAFKGRNSFGVDGQTSPIPSFVIPSYASGIIFRNSDNDKSPQVEIQPAIHVASKTIGPEEESAVAASDSSRDIDSAIPTTTSTFKRIGPTTNVNLVNSFERKTFAPPLQTTTSFYKTSTVTQASIAQNEIQNNSPLQSSVSTTLSPLSPSQINTMPTIDKATNQPRFSDITKRIEILGLQAPGYAIRSDGTIDSEAVPPNFAIKTNTRFTSNNNVNPLDFGAAAAASTTQQTTYTTTPRVTRTTAFIPSKDNPFLPRKPKQQNINATPAPFTAFQRSTQTNTFATSTKSGQFVTINNRNQPNAIGNGFASFAPQTSTNSSPFNKIGSNQNLPNQANGQFGNRLQNSRQSKSYNELSFNAQQQAQRKNQQAVLNLDNRAQLPPFGVAETTTFPSSSFGAPSTTKRVQSFASSAIPTAKAPAGFSFAPFAKIATTTKPTPRTRIVPTTNVPTTFSTIFPSKYTFSTIPTTVSPLAQSDESSLHAAAEPSIELLPPVSSNTADAKSAFAPINEAGALVRSKSPAFSAGATNRNQQQQQPSNSIIKPFNANNSPSKVNNGFTAFPSTTTRQPKPTVTTKNPGRYRPVFSTTTFKFTTTTRTPTTTSFASLSQQNQPNAKAPYIDLLPPIESDSQTKESSIVPSTNAFEQSISISLPNNDLLPPPLTSASDAQTQNSQSSNTDAASAVAAGVRHGTTTTTGSKADQQQQNSNQESALDLNPFLPPVDAIPKSPPVLNSESNSENNNEYTTITLEQNPFLPQLDLNPFLPPFIFSPSENDPGFGFGAGTPPPPSDDETPASSNIVAQSTNAPLKFRFKRSSENRGQL